MFSVQNTWYLVVLSWEKNRWCTRNYAFDVSRRNNSEREQGGYYE